MLTEAVRTRTTVRVYVSDPSGGDRPARIVEGVVQDVADGRDGRTRVRIAIPTGSGDPVEVRILVEGIERAEVIVATTPGEDGVVRHASQERMSIPGIRRTLAFPSSERRAPDETGPRPSIKR